MGKKGKRGNLTTAAYNVRACGERACPLRRKKVQKRAKMGKKKT